MNAARVVGPVLAGFIIALAGVRWVYVVAVTMYAIALFSMSRVSQSPPVEGVGKRPVLSELWGGMRYVAGDPPVRADDPRIVPMLLAMPFQALLVVFAEDIWHQGSSGLGLCRRPPASADHGVVFRGLAGRNAAEVADDDGEPAGVRGRIVPVRDQPWFLLALPLVLLSDVFASTFVTLNNTAIQLLIPDEVRGRVMALMMMTFGLTPLGTVPVAAMAQAFGAPTAVAVAAVVTAGLSVAIFALSRALRGIDATSQAALEADALALAGGGAAGVAAPASAGDKPSEVRRRARKPGMLRPPGGEPGGCGRSMNAQSLLKRSSRRRTASCRPPSATAPARCTTWARVQRW